MRVEGLIAAIELTKDKTTREQYPYEWGVCQYVSQAVITKGLIIRPAGNVLIMCPPFIISKSEVDMIVEALRAGLDQTHLALSSL